MNILKHFSRGVRWSAYFVAVMMVVPAFLLHFRIPTFPYFLLVAIAIIIMFLEKAFKQLLNE